MPCTLDETLFAQWQAVFASRIGRPQMELAQIADDRAFCKVFDSDAEFDRAAQYVYERWASWDSWPAPIEFESARAHLRRIPDAEIKATLKAIDESRRLAPPPSTTRNAALDQFAIDWRKALAHCMPESFKRELREQLAKDREDAEREGWLTDEKRAQQFPPETPERQQDADADRDVA